MTEENVYGKIEGTEEIATAKLEMITAEKLARNEEKASAVPEKFKDVDALVRAYAALQSEFTRRSQRLKELEKKVENFKENRADASGAEKLRKNAEVRKRAAKAFDDFVAGVESLDDRNEQKDLKPTEEQAEPTAQALEDETQPATAVTTVSIEQEGVRSGQAPLREEGCENGDGGNGSVETPASVKKEWEMARQPVAESGSATISASETLYQTVTKNEDVRLRIIGDYLASIGNGGAPLTTGNVGTLTTPPQRAKSIGAASAMALRYLKTPFGKE